MWNLVHALDMTPNLGLLGWSVGIESGDFPSIYAFPQARLVFSSISEYLYFIQKQFN